jgi:hypothetical protein
VRAAKAGLNFMGDGMVLEGDARHLSLGEFPAFADRVGHFAGLAQTHSDTSLLVAHHNEGAKAKTASAFNDFGRAVDENDLLREFGDSLATRGKEFSPTFTWAAGATLMTTETPVPAACALAATFNWFCHSFFLVKLEL